LNYLAPGIVAAIVDGTQPSGLDCKSLASAHIPLDWTVQRRIFGFAEPRRPAAPRNLFGRGLWPSGATPPLTSQTDTVDGT
jgi:site-specific DNA recombinase